MANTMIAAGDSYFHVSYGIAADPNEAMPRVLSKPKDHADAVNSNPPTWMLVATVLLPFAAGYYLGYLYRTINALISDTLVSEFQLTAGDLGFLTAALFLTFGAIQLPLGAWLDRFGPRRVQTVLLSIAAMGAAVFAHSQSLPGLIAGRAMIGIGVAGALMAGLKAIVLWWPADRIAMANGWLITIGALGAVTATMPAEILIASIGWRSLFVLLAVLTALSALVILLVAPEPTRRDRAAAHHPAMTIRAIYRDARFWRLAPLSATSIGSAWALQSLWAAPWLASVEGLSRQDVVMHLLVMAIALSASPLMLGAAGDRLRRRGVPLEATFAFATSLAMIAQFALILRLPVPTWLPWIAIAGIGAATVLAFAILAEMFPKSASGRANGALNVLHIGAAFAVQVGIGCVVEFWPIEGGLYPPIAHQTAFSVNLGLQGVALLWFVRPERGVVTLQLREHPVHKFAAALTITANTAIPYLFARQAWSKHNMHALHQTKAWRLAAVSATAGMISIAISLSLAMHERSPKTPQRQLFDLRDREQILRLQSTGIARVSPSEKAFSAHAKLQSNVIGR